jgi:hypothetical protein
MWPALSNAQKSHYRRADFHGRCEPFWSVLSEDVRGARPRLTLGIPWISRSRGPPRWRCAGSLGKMTTRLASNAMFCVAVIPAPESASTRQALALHLVVQPSRAAGYGH